MLNILTPLKCVLISFFAVLLIQLLYTYMLICDIQNQSSKDDNGESMEKSVI
jgi:hypothetical protein